MFCPKCNQLQASEEMRFCSRCGFQLETVAQLLKNDGVLPAQSSQGKESIRSRMATESVVFTILSWAIALLCTFWFDASGIFEGVAKLGALIFFLLGFIGLFRFLYAFLFLKIAHPDLSEKRSIKEGAQSALPPPQTTPFGDWRRRENTREMVQQPSITENTTKLLDET